MKRMELNKTFMVIQNLKKTLVDIKICQRCKHGKG